MICPILPSDTQELSVSYSSNTEMLQTSLPQGLRYRHGPRGGINPTAHKQNELLHIMHKCKRCSGSAIRPHNSQQLCDMCHFSKCIWHSWLPTLSDTWQWSETCLAQYMSTSIEPSWKDNTNLYSEILA